MGLNLACWHRDDTKKRPYSLQTHDDQASKKVTDGQWDVVPPCFTLCPITERKRKKMSWRQLW